MTNRSPDEGLRLGEDLAPESFTGYELLRTWAASDFTLKLYDTHKADRDGKSVLAFELFDASRGELAVFNGDDFHCSPLHAVDSDRTVASLLSFLSLRPGDTDREHFADYTPAQLAWCQDRGEELSFFAHALELPFRPLRDATITHETWDEAYQAGRYIRALTLAYKLEDTAHRVTLSAGESDHLDTLTDGRAAYVITTNSGLGYVGIEVFADGLLTGDVFFDGNKVGESLGDDAWDVSPTELLDRLLPFLPDNCPPPPSRSEGRKKVEDQLQSLAHEVRQRIQTFLAIGRQNPWIREAWDPPFNERSFHVCKDVDELAEMILRGNWSLGQAFVLGDICFVNQVDGGDEWLTIKGSTAFESITMRTPRETTEQAAERLRQTVERIQRATEEQCKRLQY